jgi:hypothetical protein
MFRVQKDEAREYRISMEAIVDAKDQEEQAMGWYYYLDDKIHFPFTAKCIKVLAKSPLNEGEHVNVIQLAPEDECIHEMFAEIEWQNRTLCVPLVQLQPMNVDEQSQEAVEDWHYWVARGYEL